MHDTKNVCMDSKRFLHQNKLIFLFQFFNGLFEVPSYIRCITRKTYFKKILQGTCVEL